MKNSPIKVFVIICMQLYSICYGQTTNAFLGSTQANYPQVLGPSPEAAALGKYGDVPVSFFSGTVNVNIPVYDFSYHDINFKIDLDYSTTGIRADQIATNVGLGWVLNAGGVITRAVRGLPDGYNDGIFPGETWNPQIAPAAPALNFGTATGDYQQAIDFLTYNRDLERDIYYFNFLGKTGKFVIDRLGHPQLIPANPALKIVFDNSTNFIITDESGYEYYFSTREIEQKGNFVCSTGINSPREYDDDFVSAWYLDKITSPTGHKVFFMYSEYQFDEERNYSEVEYIRSQPLRGDCPTDLSYLNQKCKRVIKSTCKRISSVTAEDSTVKVSFVYSTNAREDLIKDGLPAGNALDFIKVYWNGNIIKTTTLNHTYFSADYNTKRLKLVSVFENDQNRYSFEYNETHPLPERLTLSQDHWGYYNGKLNGTFIPPVIEINHFTGANRESDFEYMQVGALTKVNYPTGGNSSFEYEPHQDVVTEDVPTIKQGQAGVSVNAGSGTTISYSDPFILQPNFDNIRLSWNLFASNYDEVVHGSIINAQNESIIYSSFTGDGWTADLSTVPFGTEVKLRIERNNLNDYGDVSVIWQYNDKTTVTHNKIVFGGLRIKSIKNYVSNGQLAEERYYSYNLLSNPAKSSIILPASATIKYFDETLRKNSGNNYPYMNPCGYWVLYSHSVPQIGSDIDNTIGYTEVVETNNVNGINGRSIYRYSKDVSDLGISVFGNANTEWAKGLLLENEIQKFDQISGNYMTVQKTVNTYGSTFNTNCKDLGDGVCDPNQTVISNIQISYTLPETLASDPSLPGYNCNSVCLYPALFKVERFRIVSAPVYLTHKHEYFFDNNKNLDINSDFYYENTTHLFPTKIETKNSKGEWIRKVLKYPQDFVLSQPYNDMVNVKHILSPVIEGSTYKVDGNIHLSSSKTNFDYWSSTGWSSSATNLILPKSLELKNLNQSNYETRLNYNIYDSKGNILERQKTGDVKEVYLWGYNGQYPVAKITGADYATISSVLTQSQIDAAIATGNENTIRTTLSALRSISNAFVTTYTYKPLVGMTSQTDPNGKTIFYYYDDFNRLQLIRDQDGKVIKKICYNYAGQVTDCMNNTNPNWQTTGSIRCKPCPSNSSYTMNMQQHQERDINTTSVTYNTTRWVDDNVAGSCVAAADWQTISTVCEMSNGQNTGYQLITKKDMNPCSATYNTTTTSSVYNASACPVTVTNVSITSTNTTGLTAFTAKYTNVSTGQVYTFTVSSAAGLQTIGTLQPGTYNLVISRSIGTAYFAFGSGCNGQMAYGRSASFSNIVVSSSGCNSITIDYDI